MKRIERTKDCQTHRIIIYYIKIKSKEQTIIYTFGINYIMQTTYQYFWNSLELWWKLLSEAVRGTVENSVSEFSDSEVLPRRGTGFGDKEVRKKPESVFFGVLFRDSFSCASKASLLSRSSFSLRRKSTHRSAKDWEKQSNKYKTTVSINKKQDDKSWQKGC